MNMRFAFVMFAILSAISWQGCESDKDPAPVDCDANPVAVQLVSSNDSNCGLDDGELEVSASGGTEPYRYKLGNNPEQAEATFTGLPAGVYEVSVADKNDCAGSMEVTIRNKDGVNMTVQTTTAGCGSTQGSIEVTPAGGTGPFKFKIGNGAFSTANRFEGLARGEYDVVVQDATGCEAGQAVKIISGVSFSGAVSQIIETNCAVTGCHSGTQSPDFRVFRNIQNNAGQIKTLTGNKTMPQVGSLTQAEINTIACWVDDGALDN